MNKQKIKDEIYAYIFKLDLSEEEMIHIDIYVKELIEYLMPILSCQEKILKDDEQFDIFKKNMIKKMGG